MFKMPIDLLSPKNKVETVLDALRAPVIFKLLKPKYETVVLKSVPGYEVVADPYTLFLASITIESHAPGVPVIQELRDLAKTIHNRRLEETTNQEKPMQENTTEIKKPFKVLANLDQLQKHGLDKKHDWRPEHPDKMPNRVVTCLETKEQAIELYNTLWRQKLVCFRNWID